MDDTPGRDTRARKDRNSVLVDRQVAATRRSLVTWHDAVTAFWLAVGLAAALLTQQQRWWICRGIGRVASRGRRHDARERIARLGNLPAEQAASVDRFLEAFRFAATFNVVRALVRGPDFQIACRGLEHLEAARARGRGAILWVSDFAGAGEVTKIALSRAGHRVKHLSRVEHGFSASVVGIRWLNPIRLRLERRYLDERVVFDRSRPSASMLRLARHLRANGVVSIAAGAHEGRTLVRARFLRGIISLAVGAPRLAAMTDARLIPVFTVARPGVPGTFDVIVEPPLQLAAGANEHETLAAAMAEYLDRLEAQVIRRPEVWVGWTRRDQFADDSAEGPPTPPRVGTTTTP